MRKVNCKAVGLFVMLWCGIAVGQDTVSMGIYAEPDKDNAGPYVDRSRRVPYTASVTINGHEWGSFSFDVEFFERAAAGSVWWHPISVSCTVPCSVFASKEAFKCIGIIREISVPGSFFAKSNLPPKCEPACEERTCVLLEQTLRKINRATKATGNLELEAAERAKLNAELKRELLNHDLPAIREALCGQQKQDISKKLDRAEEFMKKADPTAAHYTGFFQYIFQGESILVDLHKKLACAASIPTPSQTPSPSLCPEGKKPSEPVIKFLKDRMKQLGEEAVKASDPELGEKMGRGLKVLDGLQKVEKARCVPQEVYNNFLECQQKGDQESCQRLCFKTADWLNSIVETSHVEIAGFRASCVGETPSQ